MNLLCFFGFHKWKYFIVEKWSIAKGFKYIETRRWCGECNKNQVKKAIPPDYSLIDANKKWRTI